MIPSCSFQDTRPYTRWWWFGNISQKGIQEQLAWLKENGFGGVEIAWIRPWWLAKKEESIFTSLTIPPSNMAWLSKDFAQHIAFTKKTAESLGLGCDFTFASAWPFGSASLEAQDQLQTLWGPSNKRIPTSWEGSFVPVLNHLTQQALDHYAEILAPAF